MLSTLFVCLTGWVTYMCGYHHLLVNGFKSFHISVISPDVRMKTGLGCQVVNSPLLSSLLSILQVRLQTHHLCQLL